jgi:anti-sigma factor RsiW
MNDQHLSDDRLIEICMASPTPAVEQAHLAVCPRCAARSVEIVAILSELDEAATNEAGEVFPDERLERQHARILQRVEHDGRPGRLVAFPAHQSTTTILMPSRPHMRWAAGVAAAAFAAGVLTGQLTHTFTSRIDVSPSHVIANESDLAPLRAVPTTFSEEEFLGQVEVAASRNGPAALRPLDAMTPRAGEAQ